jgi:surface antigen
MRAANREGMTTKLMSVIVGASLLAGACATESGTGTAVGAGGGALIGGLAGGWQGAVIGGALGGILGYGVGRSAEIENDRRMEAALAAQGPQTWQNPDTGNMYTVAPQPIYYSAGRQCREFSVAAQTQDGPRNVYGTACRGGDGRWQVVNSG